MIKKIWHILGDLGLTYWLLLAVTLLFVVGMFYSLADYAFFESLDTQTVQEWLRQNGPAHPEKVWWVVALLAALGVLGVNTLVCAADRIAGLWTRRNGMEIRVFFLLLTPSIVHCLFVGLLAAHFLTVARGIHQRIPITEGTVVTLPSREQLKIGDIEFRNYPSQSLLRNRVQQVDVRFQELMEEGEPPVTLQFLKPLYRQGFYLHLDLEQQPGHAHRGKKESTVCNRAEVSCASEQVPQVFLVVTHDPGLYVIVAVFTLICLLMLWYYLAGNQIRIGNGLFQNTKNGLRS